jgi:tRNA threonylcarbamoyladenosine modification (KEOPS) complex  Pcc1 subunit
LKGADRRIIIILNMHSPELAAIVSKTFEPEVSVSHASGSGVQISIAENHLTLCFEAQSTATMRALINSYLRWVMMIDKANAVFNEEKSK